MPCEIWKATKDPSMTQEEFEKDLEKRVANLREATLTIEKS